MLGILLSPPQPFPAEAWSMHTLMWLLILMIVESVIAYKVLVLPARTVIAGVFLAKTAALLLCLILIKGILPSGECALSAFLLKAYLSILLCALVATMVERSIFAFAWSSQASLQVWKVAVLANGMSLIMVAVDFLWRTTLFPPTDTL